MDRYSEEIKVVYRQIKMEGYTNIHGHIWWVPLKDVHDLTIEVQWDIILYLLDRAGWI